MNIEAKAYFIAIMGLFAAQLHAQQCDVFTAQTPSFDDGYGHEVVVGDAQLFVSAPYEDDDQLGNDSGAVYVYEIVSDQLRLVQHVQPPEPSRTDWFGSSIAVGRDTLVIGASGDDDNGRASGSVFVYRKTDDEWKFDYKLIAYDGGFHDSFGRSLALDDRLLAVAAPGFDGVAEATGKVYLFDLDTGLLLHEFVGDDTSLRDGFGNALAMGDGHLFVGVPSWDMIGADTTGAVYVFDLESGQQRAKFTSGQERTNQAFGRSIAYEDSHLLVGAPGQDRLYDDGQYHGRIGAVYHYRLRDEQIELISIIQPSDVVQYDEFGSDIAMSQGLAAISSPSCTSYCTSTDARTYVYDLGSESLIERYVPQGPFYGSAMGRQVELFGDYVVIASEIANSPNAMFSDAPSGAGVLFDRRLYNCLANVNNDCVVDRGDIVEFQDSFVARRPLADINNDGLINFFDVSAFIVSFNGGCP